MKGKHFALSPYNHHLQWFEKHSGIPARNKKIILWRVFQTIQSEKNLGKFFFLFSKKASSLSTSVWHCCMLACLLAAFHCIKKCLWKWGSFYKLNNGLKIKTNRLSIKEFFPLLNDKVFYSCPILNSFTYWWEWLTYITLNT